MSVQKARQNYLERPGPWKMNCCESVAYAFRQKVPLSVEELQSYAGFGGGRAPEGYCGAIYAAKRLLEALGSSKVAELYGIFQDFAGSVKCREIKALKKISCLECVEKAAGIVEGA
ncbi:MAG TPA: C-GCAxxG-C-C family protein [Candidatus Omnitrophota bacterium]|nr:C-GCAxxG-C-C family protein [Candidatus Omnitrophota bacterium]